MCGAQGGGGVFREDGQAGGRPGWVGVQAGQWWVVVGKRPGGPVLPWGSGKWEGSPRGVLLCLGRGGPSVPPDCTPVCHPASLRSSAVCAPWALPTPCQNQRLHGFSVCPEAGPARQQDLDCGPQPSLWDLESPCLGPRIPQGAAGHDAPPSVPAGHQGRLRARVGAHPSPPSPPLGQDWTPILSAPPSCPCAPRRTL